MTDTTKKLTTEQKEEPFLKLAFELGPLMVFFFANFRGEWLMNTFPALSVFGTPLLVATALFMIAKCSARDASSPGCSPKLAGHMQ